MKRAAFYLAASLTVGLSGACLAEDLKAETKFTDTALGFEVKDDYSNLTLTVAGPHRFHASASARSGGLEIDLRRFGPIEDGAYTYHLTGATREPEKIRTKLDNGRSAGAEPRKSARTERHLPCQGRRDRQAGAGHRQARPAIRGISHEHFSQASHHLRSRAGARREPDRRRQRRGRHRDPRRPHRAGQHLRRASTASTTRTSASTRSC